MLDVSRLPDDDRTGLAPARAPRPRRSAARAVGIGAVLAVGALVAFGAWGEAERRSATLETLQQQEDTVPAVHTADVATIDGPRTLDLPGNIQAFDSATVFARATGYIAKRNVDIGSKVHAGDVLAVIAAPDLDQQLVQARAQLVQLDASVAQARANADLAQATNTRTVQLVVQGWQTKEQGDIDRLTLQAQNAALRVAQANLVAQQAQVSRLVQLTDFERVVAPFNGVITSRQIDVGSLVTADVSSGTPLFSIDRTDVLRVQIYVPQDAVFGLKDGATAQVMVPEIPGRVFAGTVARNATALDPGTRTLLTEVDVQNTDGTLDAGLYCTVRLSVPRRAPVALVPSQAVIFDKNGLSVAVYEDGRVRLQRLDVEADDGAQVEVRAGLKPGDRIILNPPIGVVAGMRVASIEAVRPAQPADMPAARNAPLVPAASGSPAAKASATAP